MNKNETGLLGEWRAARYLKRRGLRIIERRFRTAHGEIDLIAKDQDTWVMVEVKARPKGKMGDGMRAVDAQKQKHLRFAAQQYLLGREMGGVRFDIVEISAAGIRHVKNAF